MVGIASRRSQQLTSGLGFLAGCGLWPGGSLGKGLTWRGCGALGLGAGGHLLFLKFSSDSLSPGESRGVFLRWCLLKQIHTRAHTHTQPGPWPLPLRWLSGGEALGSPCQDLGDGSPACPSGSPALPFLKKGGGNVSTAQQSWASLRPGLQRVPREQLETHPWDRMPLPAADFCLSFGAHTDSLPRGSQHAT